MHPELMEDLRHASLPELFRGGTCMKTKKTERLTLSRETIQHLEDRLLQLAKGGDAIVCPTASWTTDPAAHS
jgi:hypothetical protein